MLDLRRVYASPLQSVALGAVSPGMTRYCFGYAELQEMHQTAQSDAKESREELDSLSNLIGRLDFNDFFKPKPDYRAMLAQGAI